MLSFFLGGSWMAWSQTWLQDPPNPKPAGTPSPNPYMSPSNSTIKQGEMLSNFKICFFVGSWMAWSQKWLQDPPQPKACRNPQPKPLHVTLKFNYKSRAMLSNFKICFFGGSWMARGEFELSILHLALLRCVSSLLKWWTSQWFDERPKRDTNEQTTCEAQTRIFSNPNPSLSSACCLFVCFAFWPFLNSSGQSPLKQSSHTTHKCQREDWELKLGHFGCQSIQSIHPINQSFHPINWSNQSIHPIN